MRPTQAQQNLAKELGLDVPEGTTKSGVSKLLSDAIEAERCDKRDDLPAEIAAVSGLQKTSAYRMGNIQRLRDSGIRVGSIVVLSDGPRGVALGQGNDIFEFKILRIKELTLVARSGLSLKHEYTPPKTHIHPFNSFPRPKGKTWGAHKETLLAFIAFAESRIASDQVFRNGHGTFWSIAAVDELRRQFIQAQTATQAVAAKPEDDKKRFCVICGKGHHQRQLPGRRCYDCRNVRDIPSERYCYLCGAKFLLGGARGGRALLCPNHRK